MEVLSNNNNNVNDTTVIDIEEIKIKLNDSLSLIYNNNKEEIDNNNNNNKEKETKEKEEFRNYNEDTCKYANRVIRHYEQMRTHSTLAFYDKMTEKYSFDNGKYRSLMTIREAFVELESFVDASDPDMDLPNLIHMLQTAEGIRKAGHPDWFQLVGLIHDMGKIQFLWGTHEDGQKADTDTDPQWALGGDTWVVGCEIPGNNGTPGVILPHLNELNPDMHNPKLNTKYGIYEPHCGLDQLKFAWGHDEYMYRMLVANNTTIPKEGLAMIRYHSAYPWHNTKSYPHFMAKDGSDDEMMEWVLEFNQFDLYTKDETENGKQLDVDELWPYYQQLVDKYLPGKLKW